jgi:hypothetical protein
MSARRHEPVYKGGTGEGEGQGGGKELVLADARLRPRGRPCVGVDSVFYHRRGW